ncbi:MAG: NAD-dependent epimerase/dehydratase family protein, partial [Dermatophilaceae bacterium]
GLPWISVMPTNLYGPRDNFSTEGSHVVPALIKRFVEARRAGESAVTNWGSGRPRRELLHVDDMASACLYLLDNYDGVSHVNLGTGKDSTIRELSSLVADAAGYTGEVKWDASKPDGTPQKLLDVRLLESLGWKAAIPLDRGIAESVEWYELNRDRVRS